MEEKTRDNAIFDAFNYQIPATQLSGVKWKKASVPKIAHFIGL